MNSQKKQRGGLRPLFKNCSPILTVDEAKNLESMYNKYYNNNATYTSVDALREFINSKQIPATVFPDGFRTTVKKALELIEKYYENACINQKQQSLVQPSLVQTPLEQPLEQQLEQQLEQPFEQPVIQSVDNSIQQELQNAKQLVSDLKNELSLKTQDLDNKIQTIASSANVQLVGGQRKRRSQERRRSQQKGGQRNQERRRSQEKRRSQQKGGQEKQGTPCQKRNSQEKRRSQERRRK